MSTGAKVPPPEASCPGEPPTKQLRLANVKWPTVSAETDYAGETLHTPVGTYQVINRAAALSTVKGKARDEDRD